MKVERISTLYKCPLCSRYVRARLRANGCLQVSLTPKFVQRRRVALGRPRLPVWTLGALGPPRYASLGRTTSTGPRLSLLPYTSASDFLRRRQAQVGRKASRFVKRGLHIPPRSYHREYRARCSAASDKLTSCSTGWEAVHRPMQGPGHICSLQAQN